MNNVTHIKKTYIGNSLIHTTAICDGIEIAMYIEFGTGVDRDNQGIKTSTFDDTYFSTDSVKFIAETMLELAKTFDSLDTKSYHV